MSKRKNKSAPSRIPIALIVTGLILIGLWGVHRYFYTRSLTLSDAILATYARTHTSGAYPVTISVGDKIRLQVVEAGKVNGVWAISQTDANHVAASALPGQSGNIIMYGHNLNSVFGYLVDTKVGDPIVIYTNDGKLHEYKISEIQVVDTSQTELLAPTTREVLTLYTCTGLLDSLRFVARALPVKK